METCEHIRVTANDAAGAAFAGSFVDLMARDRQAEEGWRSRLRERGIVATHPDDGWVNRDRNSIHFCYPHMMGALAPGALVALGTHRQWRLVRLLEYKQWLIARDDPNYRDWYFEEVGKKSLGI